MIFKVREAPKAGWGHYDFVCHVLILLFLAQSVKLFVKHFEGIAVHIEHDMLNHICPLYNDRSLIIAQIKFESPSDQITMCFEKMGLGVWYDVLHTLYLTLSSRACQAL